MDNAWRIPKPRQGVGHEEPHFPTYNPFHSTCFPLHTSYTPQFLICFRITSPFFYTHLAHVPSHCVSMSFISWMFLHNTIVLKYRSHSDYSQPTSPLQHPRVPQVSYLSHTITPSAPLRIPSLLQWSLSYPSLSCAQLSCTPYSIFETLPHYPLTIPITAT